MVTSPRNQQRSKSRTMNVNLLLTTGLVRIMTLTSHYINEACEYHSCVMNFKVLHGSTTGPRFGGDIFKVFYDYAFDEGIVLVVTDTTGIMRKFRKA